MSTKNTLNSGYILVLQDGRMGTDGQSRGLAQALAKPMICHNFKLLWWQKLLPMHWLRNDIIRKHFDDYAEMPLAIIGAGRSAAYGLLAAQKKWPEVISIQIQNPKILPHNFSYLIVPQHDAVTGMNVITTLGGLHAVTDDTLQAARIKFQEKFAGDAPPRVAILIGGNNKFTQLDDMWCDHLTQQLQRLLASGHRLWVTTSRRTPKKYVAALKDRLNHPHVFFWDGVSENPYLGMLALADKILVTADSISMISEALFTAKPVALLAVPGHSKKFQRFYDALLAGGYSRWFDGAWENTPSPRLQETQRVAGIIKEKLDWV
jgi:mitochondrial fission protein ELM1